MILTERQVMVSGMSPALPTTYIAAGNGPPLLLLHGLGDSAQSWQWVLPALAQNYRVYAPNLPGFGTSSKPITDYSPAFFTAFVGAFLDELQLDRVSIVGNSLGGLIALQLALSDPARVSSLGLISSAGLGRQVTLAMRLLTLPGLGKLATSWHRTAPGAWQWALNVSLLLFSRPARIRWSWLSQIYHMARMPGYLEATVSAARNELTLKGQREHLILLDALPHVRIPTLVLWGTRDRVIPPHQSQAAVTRLPHGNLAIIPGAGHIPHVECPDLVVSALSRFLPRHTEVVRPLRAVPSFASG